MRNVLLWLKPSEQKDVLAQSGVLSLLIQALRAAHNCDHLAGFFGRPMFFSRQAVTARRIC